jgi:phenylpyruvate tautomerase PptA (4-oxalocrotonate tautomerase family)
MPILDIEIVASDPDPSTPSVPSRDPGSRVPRSPGRARRCETAGSGWVLPANLTQSLADEAAQVFGAPDGTVWVKVRVIPSAHYAEDHGTPPGVYPVFVTVLKSRVRAEPSRSIQKGSELEDEIARLTKVIAKVLNRSEENVHILYHPDGAGRVAFGGKLVL